MHVMETSPHNGDRTTEKKLHVLTPQISAGVVRTSLRQFDQLQSCESEDALAVEEPLEIRLIHGPTHDRQTKALTVTMRTPGNDLELAAGFLLTEGVLDDSAHIMQAHSSAALRRAEDGANSVLPASAAGNILTLEISPEATLRTATLERNFYTTSSCGVCGKASLLALRSVCPPRRSNDLVVSAEMLYSLPDKLRAAQSAFELTGGLHGAGLFSVAGELLMLREDVGRHNAVDKLIGAQFLADATPLRGHILMLSGRASFDLLQKAVMAGISLVAAVGAPSSLAVAVAREFDVTLVGFLRGQRCNVYHGAHRVVFSSEPKEPEA